MGIKLIDLLFEGKADNIECQCGWSWKKSEGGKDINVCHKCGHDNTPKSFDEFAETRMKGADKIATNAKKKGGLAMLTYHHFNVKAPYYKKAAAGKFNIQEAKSELKKLHTYLHAIIDKFEAKGQTPFQQVMGKIEVVGELIIKYNETH